MWQEGGDRLVADCGLLTTLSQALLTPSRLDGFLEKVCALSLQRVIQTYFAHVCVTTTCTTHACVETHMCDAECCDTLDMSVTGCVGVTTGLP
jgi:hypothetical protein